MYTTLTNPRWLQNMFAGTGKWTWAWLVVRVYVGWQWVEAGWHKIGDPKWMKTGLALKGFWEKSVAIPDASAKPLITYDWYRSFLEFLLHGEHYTWFAKFVAVGELLVGIGLIVGAIVGITAFFGALMNFNYMLAGSASTNPVLFLGAILLMIAWRTAGYWGIDRWLLPRLGSRMTDTNDSPYR